MQPIKYLHFVFDSSEKLILLAAFRFKFYKLRLFCVFMFFLTRKACMNLEPSSMLTPVLQEEKADPLVFVSNVRKAGPTRVSSIKTQLNIVEYLCKDPVLVGIPIINRF